ncbi:M23 family metallopeptidase [Oculatella sp. LEGE 06141]|uniref:M23 family metallopeptidase n=1 Tax=Oculatella sp. LEGE 06141 TaxID=1828648 RepID=UPI0030D7C067
MAVSVGVFLAIALPTVWIGTVVYSYVQKNYQLTQRNTQLEQEATDILERLDDLEGEIKHLQRRAGISDSRPASEEPLSYLPSGGERARVQPEVLFDAAKAQLPLLSRALRGEVKPALEKTLVREEARPRGIPLKVETTITSKFGLRPNPFGRGYEFHKGIDFRGDYGTPIYVTAPGLVETAGWDPGFGNHVIVDHGYGYRTLYAHLSKIEVTQGIDIERDRVVGYLGSTGRSSGPHLHYSVYHHDEVIDPQDYLD